jgi:hypothetical protein
MILLARTGEFKRAGQAAAPTLGCDLHDLYDHSTSKQGYFAIMRQLFNVRILLMCLLICLTLSACQPPDNKSRVVFDNQTACGTITITLTSTITGQEQKVDAPAGQKTSIEVQPNVFYSYVVDFTSAGSTNGLRCTEVSSGRLAVPSGASQTFVLQAQPPTATVPVQ